jgi:peptide/nickel transport system permease protein
MSEYSGSQVGLACDEVPATGPVRPAKARSPWSIAWAQLRRNKGAMAGLVVFGIIVIVSVLAPLLAPYDPIQISPQEYLQPPSLDHPFGTDSYGRDVFSRTLYGGRISLRVGIFSVAIAAVVGVILGLAAGYFGHVVDGAIMRFVDMLLAFPGLLLALGVVALLGPGISNVIIAVGISGISGYARTIRGCVLSAREEVYVEAARSVGCRDWYIVGRHLLPNVVGPAIVLSTLDIAWAILTASSLSFLGLGSQPPTPEWGLMLSEGRGLLREAPWQTVFPGLMIMLTVLAVNLFGDGLRDALDPRMYE